MPTELKVAEEASGKTRAAEGPRGTRVDLLDKGQEGLVLTHMAKRQSTIVSGGVPEYISQCPKEAQAALKSIRAAIRSLAPDAMETVSYFEMPGFSCAGNYAYNGMCAWFSYKAPYVRVHVLPQVLKKHKKDLANYATTAAIVSFPSNRRVPIALAKKLVKDSLTAVKERPKT